MAGICVHSIANCNSKEFGHFRLKRMNSTISKYGCLGITTNTIVICMYTELIALTPTQIGGVLCAPPLGRCFSNSSRRTSNLFVLALLSNIAIVVGGPWVSS